MIAADARLLVAHIVYRFDVGGLENGVVNLVNRLPADRFRHAIVALTEVTDFRRRIARDDVQYVSLHKSPGQGVRQWPALLRVLRTLRPDIVHTRNLAPLEAMVPAWLSGVRVRVHGEHGWDVGDLDGDNSRHRLTRRLYRPFVTRYVALSRHIADYLQASIGVAAEDIAQIYNGVDTRRFCPPAERRPMPGCPFEGQGDWRVGTVGRLAEVKNQAGLIRAVAAARRASGAADHRLRLIVVGDGPLRGALQELARSEGIGERVWFAGERDDVADLLAGFDAFALPSLAEGISNTLLEAMATGLPSVATTVGGNTELLADGRTGTLVPSDNVAALDAGLRRYLSDPHLARSHGRAAREEVERRFSLERMVAEYAALYETAARRRRVAALPSEAQAATPQTSRGSR